MDPFHSLAPTVIGQGDKRSGGGASNQAGPPPDPKLLQKNAQDGLKVDESQPVTSVQVIACWGDHFNGIGYFILVP